MTTPPREYPERKPDDYNRTRAYPKGAVVVYFKCEWQAVAEVAPGCRPTCFNPQWKKVTASATAH